MKKVKENEEAILSMWTISHTILYGILLPAKEAARGGDYSRCNQLIANPLPNIKDRIDNDKVLSKAMLNSSLNPPCIGLFALATCSYIEWPYQLYHPFQFGPDPDRNGDFIHSLIIRIATFQGLIGAIYHETHGEMELPSVKVITPPDGIIPYGFIQIQPPEGG